VIAVLDIHPKEARTNVNLRCEIAQRLLKAEPDAVREEMRKPVEEEYKKAVEEHTRKAGSKNEVGEMDEAAKSL
jgi:ribonucleotide reductase beta subunit family protein with ferritin-like domain